MKVPILRFPKFIGEWPVHTIAEIGRVITGTTPSTVDRSLYGDDYNFVTPGDMNTGRYVTRSKQRLSKKGTTASRLVPARSTLFVCIGSTIGKIAQLIDDSVTNQQINSVVPGRSYNQDFVYYALLRISSRVASLAGQQAVPLISKNDFGKNKLFLPTKSEQEKIAGFLNLIDKKIELETKKLALLKHHKNAVARKTYKKQIRFNDAEGQSFPEWQYSKLGSIFKEVTTRVGGDQAPPYSITAGVGFVSQKEKFGRDISGEQGDKYTLLKQGQFAYNKGNSKTFSYGCIYANHEKHAIAVPNVFICFELTNRLMSIDYFEQMFMSHYLDRSLRQIISSGARMDGLLNINKSAFYNIEVPVPAIKEQNKIASFLVELSRKIETEQARLQQLQGFKQELLRQMLV